MSFGSLCTCISDDFACSLSANGLEGRENGRSGVGSRGEAGGRSRHDKVGSGFRGRGRGDGNRGRGRGRGPNLVQLDGRYAHIYDIYNVE